MRLNSRISALSSGSLAPGTASPIRVPLPRYDALKIPCKDERISSGTGDEQLCRPIDKGPRNLRKSKNADLNPQIVHVLAFVVLLQLYKHYYPGHSGLEIKNPHKSKLGIDLKKEMNIYHSLIWNLAHFVRIDETPPCYF